MDNTFWIWAVYVVVVVLVCIGLIVWNERR